MGGNRIRYLCPRFRPTPDSGIAAAKRTKCAPLLLLLVPLLLPFTSVRADICVTDAWDNGAIDVGFVFPNWQLVRAGSFDILLCDGCVWQATERIIAITVVNFGTATGADIKAVYWKAECGGTNTGLQTMTFKGNYVEDSGTFPAWTWSGLAAEISGCAAMWVGGPGYFTVNIYADIESCPKPGVTVRLGLPIHSALDPVDWGSLYDNAGCVIPWGDLIGPSQTILYTRKESSAETPAPGDTITYTIYYGKPGTAALTGIQIMDTQPPYTHYVPGSAVPAPDTFWDPNPGPPPKLRWTLAGPFAVTGGPTSALTFSVTVDWGNGDAFEAGSGNVAAPEGARLDNRAQVFFNGPGMAGCTYATVVNPPVTAVVRRFLMWKVGNNDVLFSPSYGQSPDEMIYSIFIKNPSETKTWWNVSVWDSVPSQLNCWEPDSGFDDPCTGWTMTPSGCAAGGPGAIVGGTTTLLTWKLDMPPLMTLSLRWKARVKPTTDAGMTAINRMSILEIGRTRIVDGTGHSGTARNFTHEAPIILPTTYTSYIGIAATDGNYWACCNTGVLATQSYWIAFFPLNLKANFTLYKQEHYADAWATTGGVSPQIIAMAGDCVSGGADWIPGCKTERIPAFYRPNIYAACELPTLPYHNIFKLTSNSPLLWELATGPAGNNMDNSTYVGTTNLTYAGYTSYTYMRVCSAPQFGDGLYIVNTSETVPTTVHVFEWNAATLEWDYQATSELATDSQWYFGPPEAESYRVISSDSRLILFKGYPGIGAGGAFNDSGTQAPNRDNGYLLSTTVPAVFYAYAGGPDDDGASLVIGNTGADADYEIWEYSCDNPFLPNPTTTHLTTQLLGNSGSWKFLRSGTVPAGLVTAGNPYVYGQGYDSSINDTYTVYKVKVTSGGPVQVYNGRDIFSPYGSGCVIHAKTPPAGVEYWFQMTDVGEKAPCGNFDIMTLDFYCPKQGTKVTTVSSDGYSASYTTTASDECVSFQGISRPAAGATRNFRTTATGGSVAVAHQIHCMAVEKIYTAPFLAQGLHYAVIVPPVVFLGQSFWITIVVLETGGATKTDYTGTTSFTSTDPGAKIEAKAMETYNYTWIIANAGVKIFINVSMTRLGLQTIVAQDTQDGSINGLGTVMVVAADVKLEKRKKLAVAASGTRSSSRFAGATIPRPRPSVSP